MGVRIPAAFEDSTGRIQRLTGEIELLVPATSGEVLTANNPPATAGFAAATGGVQTATINVGSPEILDLFNTPVTLVPGTANAVTVVVSVGILYLAGPTPYTDHGGSLVVDTGALGVDWATVSTSGFWTEATAQVAAVAPSGPTLAAALTDAGGTDILLTQDTANPTDGNGSLTVTVAYFLATVA